MHTEEVGASQEGNVDGNIHTVGHNGTHHLYNRDERKECTWRRNNDNAQAKEPIMGSEGHVPSLMLYLAVPEVQILTSWLSVLVR